MEKTNVVLFSFMSCVIVLFIVSCGIEEDSDQLKVSNDGSLNETDDEKIFTSNNKLGFEVLLEIGINEEDNILISPMSLMMALSMVYNGASGETKEEIANTLHVKGISNKELNQANALLIDLLNNTDDVQLNIANSIWLNDDFHFQKGFSQPMEDYFNVVIEEIDILHSDSVVRINDWVKDATNEKIETIVEPPLSEDLVTILMNAHYFNGDWTYGFNEEQVEEKPFFNVDGTTKDISFMSLTKRLNYFENDSFQAVSLPYGEGEVSMNVFLPKEGRSIHDLQQLLTNENWNMWKSEFKEQDGTIILPKFQFEYGIDLKDVLIALGMNRAFSNEAQFTNMVNESGIIKISKVKQKTFIDVNEKGTEAAAVTSVEIVVESAVVDHQPFHMEVNRPFFFTITHNETGVNLFLGLISHLGED